MLEMNGGMGAMAMVERIEGSLSSGSLFAWSGRNESSSTSRFEAVVEQGRSNGVRPGLYKGRRDVGFDVEGLYCYLLERAEAEYPGGVEGVCELFEAEVGQVPVGVRRDAVAMFEGSEISEAPAGDDLRRVAAVDMFVDAVAKHCQGLEATDGVTVGARGGGA
jgi:hypothetical protein